MMMVMVLVIDGDIQGREEKGDGKEELVKALTNIIYNDC